MKKHILSLFVAPLAMLITHCGGAPVGMPGGEFGAKVDSPQVIAAADFAVRAEAKALQKEPGTRGAKLSLVSIASAKEQVVAGANYRMKLKVTLDGRTRTAEATVWWQAWNKETPYRLTSWIWE